MGKWDVYIQIPVFKLGLFVIGWIVFKMVTCPCKFKSSFDLTVCINLKQNCGAVVHFEIKLVFFFFLISVMKICS